MTKSSRFFAARNIGHKRIEPSADSDHKANTDERIKADLDIFLPQILHHKILPMENWILCSL